MKKTTVVIIPESANSSKQFQLPVIVIRLLAAAGTCLAMALGFWVNDYIELRSMRSDYIKISAENEGLKGEARLLMGNLDKVKESLGRVQDYATQLSELTKVRVDKVTKKTGIGPLSPDEEAQARRNLVHAENDGYMPLGVDLDRLAFRPIFDRLSFVGASAKQNAFHLQKLLSSLSQQKSMLSSIPSISPVNGWVTSTFGPRISPFTGERSLHQGIDVAAPIGTPIYAPADGVVIFTGAKAGFGNFIMIAHGYGVVSRYGHNAQNMVHPGQRVKRGDQIGTVGMTGRTTGPHLHYEVVLDGQPVNPKRFILRLDDQLSVY